MRFQNEYMKSSLCPKFEQNIREISTLEDYIDQVLKNVGLSEYIQYIFTETNVPNLYKLPGQKSL